MAAVATLTFNSLIANQSFTIIISDDEIVEVSENFLVQLSSSDTRVSSLPVSETIFIVDDDGKLYSDIHNHIWSVFVTITYFPALGYIRNQR